MTKYIDAEHLKWNTGGINCGSLTVNYLHFIIDTQEPTINVVRCKNCKFSYVDGIESDGVESFRACKLKRDSEAIYGLWVVSDDDFCSWAEPKDE